MEIVIIEPIRLAEEQIANFENEMSALGHSLVVYDDMPTDNEKITKRIQDADIVLSSNMRLDEEVINNCENLKMISVAFAGVDHIDANACKVKGIAVCNAGAYSIDAVAELTIGLMLSVLRKIVYWDSETRNLKTYGDFLGTELKGKTVGIIGTGQIGLRTAEILKVFGCKIIAYSRTEKPGIKYVSLKELMSKSDIITLHIPLRPETNKLISKEMISLMKPSAILINTARGKIVDNAALAEALKNNEIAGAGIDVYEEEPPLKEENPLLSTQNTVLSPHLGFATKEAIENRGEIVLENVRKFLKGEFQNRVI